jgi:hypothetical protein
MADDPSCVPANLSNKARCHFPASAANQTEKFTTLLQLQPITALQVLAVDSVPAATCTAAGVLHA